MGFSPPDYPISQSTDYPILCGADLDQVMDQMPEVIPGQEPERDRASRSDTANGVQLRGRQVGYYVSEVTVVIGPERHKKQPTGILKSLHTRVSNLVVARKIQRVLKRRADKSLVVV